jgi:TatD DNase family protein
MKPYLIDTHTHLDFEQYNGDRENVIRRAKEAQVKALITIGIDLETSQKSIAIADSDTNIFAAVGFHPHDATKADEESLLELERMLEHPKVVAIGEVGLDFYRNISPPDVQKKLLKLFLGWSLEKNYPLIIHTREADEEIINIIREKSRTGWSGVFHCFSGDAKMAEKVLEMGFYISFTGNITFKNSLSRDVMKSVPLDKLLIETDSPFLAPVPHRGRRNEPAYVNQVAQKVAEVKGLSVDKVAKETTKNAIDLFGLKIQDEEE